MKNHIRNHLVILFVAALCGLLYACGPSADTAGKPSKRGDSQRKDGGTLADQIRGLPPEEQIEYLQDMEANGTNTPELQFLLGVALYSSGMVDSSEAFFRKAIDMDSTYSRAYVNLGIVLDARHKDVEAEFMYKKALELDPDDELANCHLGFIYQSRGLYEKAVDHYLKALESNPNSAQAHYDLGLAFADSRIFREALLEWEKVIELDPDGVLGRTAKENVDLIKQYLETDTE